MKILVVGNSQAGCLKMALDHAEEREFPAMKTADWIVIPGGTGPNLRIKDNQFNITHFDPRYPPRYSPNKDILSSHINDYDLIIISALGYIDGGFFYNNKIASDALCPLSIFRRKAPNEHEYPLSESCFREVAINRLSMQPGFLVDNQLRIVYAGIILVQPFPMLSSDIEFHEGWHLAHVYKNPKKVNHFLLDLKDNYLQSICNEKNTYLLPYPNKLWRSTGFTPSKFMQESDYLHPKKSYGEAVLSQLETFLDG